MNLLVVASTNQIATANYLIAAFRRGGHRLHVCSDVAGSDVDTVVSGVFDAAIVARRARFVPDALLFIEGGSMRLLPDTRGLTGCVCAWYAIDTHMDFRKHVRIGRLFDKTFVAQLEFVKRLSDAGVAAVEWLPLAFPVEFAQVAGAPRTVDVAYVGSEDPAVHPVRSTLLRRLRATFSSTSIGRASPREMAQIYARAQIVFNKSVNNDVNMRYFEAMGSGAVLLTDRVVANGIEQLFVEGRHYVAYADEDELVRQAQALLADESRMRRIGDAARASVLAAHTYDQRAATMVRAIGLASKSACPDAHELAGAALSLGLYDAAVSATAEAIGTGRGGAGDRLAGALARTWLWPLSLLLRGVERVRAAVRGRV